jgi:hypothetical protein
MCALAVSHWALEMSRKNLPDLTSLDLIVPYDYGACCLGMLEKIEEILS